MTTELPPPRGHGVVRVAHNLRCHITDPRGWACCAGTDFWVNFSDLTLVPGGKHDLVDYGWLENGTWVTLASSGADLLDADDVGDIGGVHCDTAGDALTSPFIFGDYAHGLQAGQFLGYMPTTLCCEMYMRFSANNDEEVSGAGFLEAGASAAYAKGDLMALVADDGTYFSLESGAAAAVGSAHDANPHLFKIVMVAGATIKWYIDGVLQANALALQTDLWPCAWVINAETDNDPIVNWVHIWYQ